MTLFEHSKWQCCLLCSAQWTFINVGLVTGTRNTVWSQLISTVSPHITVCRNVQRDNIITSAQPCPLYLWTSYFSQSALCVGCCASGCGKEMEASCAEPPSQVGRSNAMENWCLLAQALTIWNHYIEADITALKNLVATCHLHCIGTWLKTQ